MTRDDGHLPLVVFTALAIAGAGSVAASALLTRADARQQPSVLLLGLGLLAAGLAVSLLHLGRRDRAHLSARGLSRVRGPGDLSAGPSAISVEGALGTAVLVLGTVSLAAVLPRWTEPYAAPLVGIAAGVFLLAIGRVSRLQGQLTWTGPSSYTPATGGIAFGAMLGAGLAGRPLASIAVVAVAVDTFVFFLRWRQVTSAALDHPGDDDTWFERRHELLGARFLLVDALPLVSLFVWPSLLGPVIAGVGLLVDRAGFYALAVQLTTETEIARVERHLDGSRPRGT